MTFTPPELAIAFGLGEIPLALGPSFAPATHWLHEWQDYWAELPSVDRLRVGNMWQTPISGKLFCLRFENHLGLATLQPYKGSLPAGPPVTLEVISRKLATLPRHRAFLTALLDDLFSRATRLPFTFHAPTGRSVTPGARPPTPLFTFHFLSQFAAPIIAACGIVQASPHRVLTDCAAFVPLAESSDLEMETVLGILQAPEAWEPSRVTALSRRLKGQAPARLWQRRPEETFDTPENRFVLAFLVELNAAAGMLPGQPWWKKVPRERQQHIVNAGVALRSLATHPMFTGVGTMQHLPSSSQVLLRRDGYWDLRELWQMFHQSRRPLFARTQHAIELRDIATLYEIWVFFDLVEEIAFLSGEEPGLELHLSDQHGLGWTARARFGNAGELIYNQSRRSYSVPLRPDYLWRRRDEQDVVLDAKFRLDRQFLEDPDEDDTPAATAKRADLYKMHTYRDALGARAAVIVYPGSESLFYGTGGARHHDLTLKALLWSDLAGIGALARQPG